MTEVSEKGKKTFTITLKAGSYHYQCDPHASSMNGDFTVA
jgi:plastocyanin